jgi:N-acetylmuramoyl-L-alanine amidase
MNRRLPFVILLVTFCYSCTQSKYAVSNKSYKKQVKAFAKLLSAYPLRDSAGLAFAGDWAGTTNMSMRRPNFVIIHHTAQNSCAETIHTFTTPRTQVSAHYVICKDGTVYHMLNDLLRAHHAGVSKWGNTTDLNSVSIGIELDNNGFESFPDAQIGSLLLLLSRLKNTFRIPASNFIGHADVAPGRKVDPNSNFPWEDLARNGFGYWYDTLGIKVPGNFNTMQALRIIGYDIKNEQNAIQSFKIHFEPRDSTKIITESDKKILFDLMQKYQ